MLPFPLVLVNFIDIVLLSLYCSNTGVMWCAHYDQVIICIFAFKHIVFLYLSLLLSCWNSWNCSLSIDQQPLSIPDSSWHEGRSEGIIMNPNIFQGLFLPQEGRCSIPAIENRVANFSWEGKNFKLICTTIYFSCLMSLTYLQDRSILCEWKSCWLLRIVNLSQL